ncbi:MAG: hypothetical protein ACI4J0_08295 [Huintestinicola sp.]|uniref:hypothetical protein n=1 Tax=Huintestinicola sp. TaxID=2981661 RepID=UPI003F0003A7
MDENFYQSAVRKAVSKGAKLLEQIEKGDISQVRCDMSGKYDGGGIYDINGKNRLLLARFLMWQDRLPDNAEELLSMLMEEEISALRQDSFQGFGYGLMILTALLNRYNHNGKYQGLFYRAKDANFDTACGYDPNECEKLLSEKIDDLSPADCIYMLIDLELYDEAAKLAEKYAEDNPPENEADYQMLIYINNYTGRKQYNLPYYEAVADIELERENPSKVSLALGNLIRAYIELGEYDKAYIAIGRAREFIFKVSEWNKCGPGRNYFEYAAELVCRMPEKAVSIWEEWRYFSVKFPDDMSMDCLKKHISAAEAVGDAEAADIFRKALDRKMDKLSKNLSSQEMCADLRA